MPFALFLRFAGCSGIEGTVGSALERLAKIDPELAIVVDMKFFGGSSSAEIGAMRNQSERNGQRNWQKPRIFLRQELSADLPA